MGVPRVIPSRPTPERISHESSSFRGVVMRDWPGDGGRARTGARRGKSAGEGDAVDDAADAAAVGLAEGGDAEHTAEGAAHGAHG